MSQISLRWLPLCALLTATACGSSGGTPSPTPEGSPAATQAPATQTAPDGATSTPSDSTDAPTGTGAPTAAPTATRAPTPTPAATAAPTPTGTPATDDDGDGYPAAVDCDDADPKVSPGAIEHVGDGVNEDCDAETDEAPVERELRFFFNEVQLPPGYDAPVTLTAWLGERSPWPTPLTAVEGRITPLNSEETLEGSSFAWTGGTDVSLEAPLSTFDFKVTNPSSLKVPMMWASEGVTYAWTNHWTVGAIPDVVGLMFIGETLYCRVDGAVQPRKGSALYFDPPGGSLVSYGANEPGPAGNIYGLSGPSPLPPLEQVYLFYFSAGDRYTTNYNEALLSEFTQGSFEGGDVVTGHSEFGHDLPIYVYDPVDVNGDGSVTWEDLAALTFPTP